MVGGKTKTLTFKSKTMIKQPFYRTFIEHLTRLNGDYIWGQSMAWTISSLFDEQHCVNIANKYKHRFPYFYNCVLSNYGII